MAGINPENFKESNTCKVTNDSNSENNEPEIDAKPKNNLDIKSIEKEKIIEAHVPPYDESISESKKCLLIGSDTSRLVKSSVNKRNRNYRGRMIESSSSSDEDISDSRKDVINPLMSKTNEMCATAKVESYCDTEGNVINQTNDAHTSASTDLPTFEMETNDEKCKEKDGNLETMSPTLSNISANRLDLQEDVIMNSNMLETASNGENVTSNMEELSSSLEPGASTLSSNMASTSELQDPPPSDPLNTGSSEERPVPAGPRWPADRQRRLRFWNRFLNSESSDTNEDETPAETTGTPPDTDEQKLKIEETVSDQLKSILHKFPPKHKWNSVLEIWKRQYGSSAKCQSSILFANGYYDSLHVSQRLNLAGKLKHHTGCVNALNFNHHGTLLASASDDLDIALWDWNRMKSAITYHSGHKDNIFQCKFLNLTGNTHIVSCARDGQVRLAELNSSGLNHTKKIAKHSRSAHKLSLRPECPLEVLSAGLDAHVLSVDIRSEQVDKLVIVKNVHGAKVPLYGIQNHPLDKNQFCVAGQDEYVRVYDRRLMSLFGPPVLKYCPNHMLGRKPTSNITAAVYSKNGDAILASYNNDDIYLFDTSQSDGAEPIHRYSGHQNSSTVKGVNFFSPNSKYVISGSDCGHIFIWDRQTEAVVNFLHGDDSGVVNCLEPHPNLPLLATSGLDDDVKIWIPTSDTDPDLESMDKTIKSNMRRRLDESQDETFGLDTHMLLMLMDTIGNERPAMRRRRRPRPQPRPREDVHDVEYDVDSSDTTSTEDDDSDAEEDRSLNCTTH